MSINSNSEVEGNARSAKQNDLRYMHEADHVQPNNHPKEPHYNKTGCGYHRDLDYIRILYSGVA
jgi:hypothetical protein